MHILQIIVDQYSVIPTLLLSDLLVNQAIVWPPINSFRHSILPPQALTVSNPDDDRDLGRIWGLRSCFIGFFAFTPLALRWLWPLKPACMENRLLRQPCRPTTFYVRIHFRAKGSCRHTTLILDKKSRHCPPECNVRYATR